MGEFAKQALTSGWQDALQSQETRLRALMPSRQEEAEAKAKALIAKYTALAEEMGRRHRLSQQSGIKSLDVLQGLPEAPGREYVAQLEAPKEAGWSDYLRDKYEDLRKEVLLGKEHMTAATEDPSTLPWFAPAMATGVPAAFMRGYQEADKGVTDTKKKELDAQLADAKAQFEKALADEMQAGRKIGSAGELIDAFAVAHCKRALFEEGDANRYLGYYLAAAALLGKGSDVVAHNLMQKYDPRRVEGKAMESAIRERMRTYPTPILLEHSLPDKSPGEVSD